MSGWISPENTAHSTGIVLDVRGRVIEDLRHAGRVFAKHPTYLLTAMLTLAVGIGFTTATFSVLNAVLLRPLPYKEPDRLVELVERALPRFPHFRVSPGHYLFWRDRATTFDGIAAWELQSVNLDTGSGGPERVRADRVTANMFRLLGVAPAAGRGFSDADDREGRRSSRSSRMERGSGGSADGPTPWAAP